MAASPTSQPSCGPLRLALFWYAVAVVLSAFVLLLSGGLVTSKGVGMAVPDWPTTYGYNMFLFPISRWVGGVFYEHSHRLIASGVGLLTIGLAFWLHAAEPRRWVRRLGWIALAAVIVQGILGGLRVTLIKDELGIFHGMLAQAYIALLVVIALALAPGFIRGSFRAAWQAPGLVPMALVLTVLVYLQLAVGATMRHEHAGLAVHDFPLAYGRVWPMVDPAELAAINAARLETGEMPTTVGFIHIHMLHRALALLLVAGILTFAWRARRAPRGLLLASRIWVGLVLLQVALGAATVLSNKAADITTAHVATGALTLWLGVAMVFLTLAAGRTGPAVHRPAPAARPAFAR